MTCYFVMIAFIQCNLITAWHHSHIKLLYFKKVLRNYLINRSRKKWRRNADVASNQVNGEYINAIISLDYKKLRLSFLLISVAL